MRNRLYLDHAATTPMRPVARAALLDAIEGWANPSSPHQPGRAARAALEGARLAIAAAYGWTGEVIFTSGATEALAIALGRAQVASRFVSAVEHDAVFRAVPAAERLPVTFSGRLDLDMLEAALAGAEAPALVAVQWGSNETGVLQPIGEVARRVHAAGGLLLVDAAQMPVHWPGPDRPQDHADFITVSGHKRGGAPGVGALLVRDLATLLPSGGQERGYRGGTENVPGVLAFAAALADPEDLALAAELRQRVELLLVAAGAEVVAPASARSPLIGAYRMPGVSAGAQLIRFDLAGISVSAGAACSSGSMRPSHVLAQMGIPADQAGEVIRVSFGKGTTVADIDRFAAVWRDIAGSAAPGSDEAAVPA